MRAMRLGHSPRRHRRGRTAGTAQVVSAPSATCCILGLAIAPTETSLPQTVAMEPLWKRRALEHKFATRPANSLEPDASRFTDEKLTTCLQMTDVKPADNYDSIHTPKINGS
jgi:hypothetical protein